MTAKSPNKKAIKDVASALLDEGKSLRIEASGYSMYPTIKAGNLIHIEPVKDPDDVSVGDIIAWQRETDMVVHRLIHRYQHDGKCIFLTRGDSGLSSDKPTGFDDLIGRVVWIETIRGKKSPVRQALIREFRYRINYQKVWILIRIKAAKRRIGRLF